MFFTRKRGRSMRLLSTVILALFLSGCITALQSRDKQIEKYLVAHPDTPAEVKEAMESRLLIKGMDVDQVRLAWGKPEKVKSMPVRGNKHETIWYYYDGQSKAAGLEDSSLFAMDVPSRRVKFNTSGKTEEWKVYDEELETSRTTALTKSLPRSVLVGKGKSGKGGQRVVRAGEYVDWPYLVLSTVMGKGDNAAAVLNGQIVGVGETVKGVRLLAVGSVGVKLQYKGEIGVLKKGESTQ